MKILPVIWSAFFIVTCFIGACSRGGCPLGTGAAGTENRTVDSFNRIVIYGKINLVLTQSPAQSLSIAGGRNLFAGVTTTVSQQTLTIRNTNTCLLTSPSAGINVNISMSNLLSVVCYGAGDISSANTLKAGKLTVDSWEGSGTIRLAVAASEVDAFVRNENATIVVTGAADSAYIYCGEAGSVDMSGLATKATELDSKTVRDIYVDASRALHAHIVYKGNVYYRNNPSLIDTLITDAGRLIHVL